MRKTPDRSKFRPDEVVAIRSLYPEVSMYRIARVFNVSDGAIRKIVKGLSYKDLPLRPEPCFSLMPIRSEVPDGHRRCGGECKEILPLNTTNFYQKSGHGFHYRCKACFKRYNAEYWKDKREAIIEARAAKNLGLDKAQSGHGVLINDTTVKKYWRSYSYLL